MQYCKSVLDSGKISEALTVYNEFLKIEPDNTEALFFAGYCAHILNDYEKAAQYYTRVLNVSPYHNDALNNLGIALKECGDLERAYKILILGNKIYPENASMLNNLGLIQDLLGKYPDAQKSFEAAIKLKPNFCEAYINKANTYSVQKQDDEAVEAIEKAIEIEPENVNANFNKSLILLNKKDYLGGFDFYEWRQKRNDFPNRKISKPILNHKNIEDKTIFVYDEQGLGDTIQFCRFIQNLKNLGAKVILNCHRDLAELLKYCKGVDVAEARKNLDGPEYHFDYHIPLLSLPKFFGIEYDSVPTDVPYILVPEEKSSGYLEKYDLKNKIKIGIVWEGRKLVENRHRSTDLEYFGKIFNNEQYAVFSLQKGPGEEERERNLNSFGFFNLDKNINDFVDTACFIKNMDLIITIDTSVAHLAGALGAKTFTLLSYKHDWRWGREENCKWYPTMKLIRQKEFGDWSSVFYKVLELLSVFEREFVRE